MPSTPGSTDPAARSRLCHAARSQLLIVDMQERLAGAMDLLEAGFQPFLVEDAACSRNPTNKANALHRLRQAGVVVTNCESVLFECLRDARHTRFNPLTALIK